MDVGANRRSTQIFMRSSSSVARMSHEASDPAKMSSVTEIPDVEREVEQDKDKDVKEEYEFMYNKLTAIAYSVN